MSKSRTRALISRGSFYTPGSPGPTRRSISPITIQGSQLDIQTYPTSGDREPGVVDSALSLRSSDIDEGEDEHHHDDIVEHLDVIDPEIATVSNLINAANAILVPPSEFYSRKPVIVLSSPDHRRKTTDTEKGKGKESVTDFDDPLDRHVEDLLTRRAKFRRIMRGVWSFLKTPIGILVGIYGFLVVFWGAGLVVLLAKWINLHNDNTQGFWIEVASQIIDGLFSVTGIGLIPFRVLDTYRVYKIWNYKRKTRILREKAGLPQLYDPDDLPDPIYDPNYVHVLTEKQQQDLHYQQERFRESQTWYRPHGTETHRAFPINTALLICLFIDGNSIFQIILCGTMWGMNRFQRPAWSTGILIPASFLCGIVSAIYIWKGGQRTKRTEEVEQTLREVLAMEGLGTPALLESNQASGTLPGSTIVTQRNANDESVHEGRKRAEGNITIDEQMNIPTIPEASEL
ncbi:hypothetical protein SERLA73DRAFT_86408 [Serpula lacrymans var. lacrymans S7.3]|uniref:Uncharacterized protein n=1 Tax=Serpula lacrymans var. lacrymans (strain S7.3) TaxID=936435 RepID=F8PQ79_SERL3|nr:hypothetical protein SERLA73DRAFT_86408 [Serpula lacrymans var. lacrymans S7.3]